MGDQLLGLSLLPLRPLLSSVIGCSPKFFLGLSWWEQQSPCVFKVGVYSKGSNLEERLLVSLGQCSWQGLVIALWGSPMGGLRRIFKIFLLQLMKGSAKRSQSPLLNLKGIESLRI